MRTALRSLVISSFVASMLALTALAETRPRYGETLRVEVRSTAFLVPGSYGADDSLSRLVFDTLTAFDANGNLQPALANTWQSDADDKRWQFWLRRNVTWHDGAAVNAAEIAQALSAANPSWHVRPVGDSVVVETDTPVPGLAAEATMLRNAIKKGPDTSPVGTGPYRIASNANGRVVLQVNQDYWRGRAFADTVEITTARTLRDQALDVDLGRTDLVEAALDDLRRGASPRSRVMASRPIEMMALVFSPKRNAVQDERVREAIALTLDRNAIQSVLLQRQGEASAAILPNWMTGYAVAFPAAQDLARARQLRNESASRTAVAVGFSGADSLARVIAERVVLNVRDAGFSAQLAADVAAADIVVERIALRSSDPWAALAGVVLEYGAQVEFKGGSWQDLFNAERDVLAHRVLVPIVHLPRVYVTGIRARNLRVGAEGSLDLPQVWIVPPDRADGRTAIARPQ